MIQKWRSNLWGPEPLGSSEARWPWGDAHFITNSSPLLRIPLYKGKSLRKALKEHGLLEDFLQKQQYGISSKYSGFGEVARVPLTNYLDVSGSASFPVMIPIQRDGHPTPLSLFQEPESPVGVCEAVSHPSVTLRKQQALQNWSSHLRGSEPG